MWYESDIVLGELLWRSYYHILLVVVLLELFVVCGIFISCFIMFLSCFCILCLV